MRGIDAGFWGGGRSWGGFVVVDVDGGAGGGVGGLVGRERGLRRIAIFFWVCGGGEGEAFLGCWLGM